MASHSIARPTPLSANWALGIFILLSLVNIIAVYLEQRTLILATKPLLMPALALYFFLVSSKSMIAKSFRFILLALFFSMLGDIFLLFSGDLFFQLGLGSFLLAHVFYVVVFTSYETEQKGFIRHMPFLAAPLVLYWGLLLWLLWPFLPTTLLFPVLLYSLVIILMALTALNLNERIPKTAFFYLFVGAILFVISDSYLALNKFKTQLQLPLPGVIIMFTYLTGQFGIVEGSRRAFKL